MALIGEFEAAGVAKHVRVHWKSKLRVRPGPRDQFANIAGGHRAAARIGMRTCD
jgi:hypothetical protein